MFKCIKNIEYSFNKFSIDAQLSKTESFQSLIIYLPFFHNNSINKRLFRLLKIIRI